MTERVPFPAGNLSDWAVKLYKYLNDQKYEQVRLLPKPFMLARLTSTTKATEDGILMFDPTSGEPVYSRGGVWYRFDGTSVTLPS